MSAEQPGAESPVSQSSYPSRHAEDGPRYRQKISAASTGWIEPVGSQSEAVENVQGVVVDSELAKEIGGGVSKLILI